MNKLFQYLPILLACFFSLFTACKSNGTINMGNDDGLSLELADSIQVIGSTYLLDSLPTSNTGSILLGELNDNDLGKTNVSSYMQFKTDFTTGALQNGAVYDSLNLVLKYNGYTYGDTLAAQRLLVNRLTERIVLRKVKGGIEDEERPVFVEGDAIYSTSSFKYEPVALGERLFTPRPKKSDSVIVNLNKALGAEMFQMIVNKDKRITDAEEFQDYFKGIVIRSENGKSINGFKADSAKIYLYYNYRSNDGMLKKSKIAFSLNLKTHQFNHIETDRKNTKLSELNYQHRELKSELTDHQLFIQGGAGIVTKLQLPGLLEFVKEPKIVINKVQLIIETKPDTYGTFKAPSSLILFIANSSNTPKSIVKAQFSDAIQQASFQKGNEAGSNGRYVFELADYAYQLKKGEHKNTSLLLSVPLSGLMNGLDRLLIKGNKPAVSVKTKILYTKF